MNVRTRIRRIVIPTALVILALFAVVACGSGDSSSDASSEYISGQDLGAFLASNMTDVNDVPLRGVDCPNERMIAGDSVICTATFGDGSTKDIKVTVKGFDDGAPRVGVDLP